MANELPGPACDEGTEERGRAITTEDLDRETRYLLGFIIIRCIRFPLRLTIEAARLLVDALSRAISRTPRDEFGHLDPNSLRRELYEEPTDTES